MLCVLVVAGCGAKKGTYSGFDDDVTAKSWEVWRNSSANAIYLRPTAGVMTFSQDLVTYPPGGTCASVPMFQVVQSTLRASLASTTVGGRMGLGRGSLAVKKYSSSAALWRELEARSLVSRVEVKRALRRGTRRGKPEWVRDFDRDCLSGAD